MAVRSGKSSRPGVRTVIPRAVALSGVRSTWTAMPAALTDYLGQPNAYNAKVNLTGCRAVRLTAARAGAAPGTGTKLRVEYGLDGSTWVAGGIVDVVIDGAAGVRESAWTLLPAAARTDVWVRLVGLDGDGAANVVIGLVVLHYR